MSEMLEDKTDQIKRYIELRELDRAKSTLKDLYHQREADLFYYSCSGVIALMENDIEGAIGVLVEGTKVFSKALDLWYNLAYAYEAKSEWQLAYKSYEMCLHCGCTFEETREFLNKLQQMAEHLQNDPNCGHLTEYDQDEMVEIIHTEMFTQYNDSNNLPETRFNVASAFTSPTDPLVTIYVVAYNKLELHTKKCIECLLKYTAGIDYELILVDNGSSDGTLEFFKSVPYKNKRIIRITKNVGAFYGSNAAIKQARGKYLVGVSNDIYVTENWLLNLLRCMFSSPDIGMAVPCSDNITNLQEVDLGFESFEELQIKAALFNQSNPRKWHERLRLIPPLCVFSRMCLDVVGGADYGFLHDFGDDDLSFRVRQAGFRAILCLDTFVCHAGKISWKDEDAFKNSLDRGRKDFLRKYRGIDAWDDVNNYEQHMIQLIQELPNEECSVLGIDVRCGTPILEAKNRLVELGAQAVRLEAYTQHPKYWSYLNALTDTPPGCDRLQYLPEYLQERKYDIILIGENVNEYEQLPQLFRHLKPALKRNGTVFFKIDNYKDIQGYMGFFSSSRKSETITMPVIQLPPLLKILREMGYTIDALIAVESPEMVARKYEIMALIEKMTPDAQTGNTMFTQLVTDSYVLKMTLKGSEC